MALPQGTLPLGGPLIATAGRSAVEPTAELRDAGVVLLDEGRWWKVNRAGDAWIPSETDEG